MTIYYNKISPSTMKSLMEKAEEQLLESEQESLKAFLTDASMDQIRLQAAYNNALSVEAALDNANPLGLDERAYGICLAGGNKIQVESSSVAGCWNGGELIQGSTHPNTRIYAPVPHGAENCVRCRWFITGAQYLPALNAHFNQLGYSAHKAATVAVDIEGELNLLLDEQIESELNDIPFTKSAELSALQKRHETLVTEANEFTKDWIACFELINRVLEIETGRSDEDSCNKLVAVGQAHDISE